MPLEINTREAEEPKGLVADRRLWLANDDKVVEDGSSNAAFLLAAPGSLIPLADCARLDLSLVDGKVVQGEVAKPEPSGAEEPEVEKPKRRKAKEA